MAAARDQKNQDQKNIFCFLLILFVKCSVDVFPRENQFKKALQGLCRSEDPHKRGSRVKTKAGEDKGLRALLWEQVVLFRDLWDSLAPA